MPLLRSLSIPAVALAAWLATTSPARAAEWSQFRGPNGQGQSTATGLPVHFSEREGIAWKQAIPGRGWSSPVILGDAAWLTTADRDGHSLRAVSVELEGGRVRRNVEVFAPEQPVPLNPKNSHASPTPVVEPGRVYVHFGAMGTACLDSERGTVLWRNTDLVIDHKEGPGSSPILFEKLLIVNCDGQDEQYVVALDKTTGRPVWKTSRSAPLRANPDFRKAYSTPVLIRVGGRPQLVSTGADQVNAYDPRTGRELWRVRYTGFSNVPVPLVDSRRVYVVTDFSRPALWAIRTDGRGDVTDSHVEWKLARLVGASASGIVAEGRIYLVTDQGVASCIEAASGRPLWQHRLGGTFSASIVLLGGRLYLCSEQGKISVVEPGDQFRLLAANQLDGRILSTPAPAGRALLVRTEKHLYRVENTGVADPPSATGSPPASAGPAERN
jgi:outer membrane protein assembly factor BamB